MEGAGGLQLAEAERESLLGSVHGVSGPGTSSGDTGKGTPMVFLASNGAWGGVREGGAARKAMGKGQGWGWVGDRGAAGGGGRGWVRVMVACPHSGDGHPHGGGGHV